ncbi:hypothetical protein PRIPAC_95228 [Pristionchus pacificus]|uniref:Uncharacterized protein n=1 Tax=Pristionchus pacificus TaxID=54126 RepID=A0A2A6BDH3_PRIPA|nr:hypothetical protein PRIPAC_95228 [Pristionchus pacificus]|eukprot:PDM63945.1 hypothetical protein PRIPAC_49446 [Pristionchus pacificus]
MELNNCSEAKKSDTDEEQETVDNNKSSSNEEEEVSSSDEYVPVKKPRVISHFEMEDVGGLYLPPVLHFQPDTVIRKRTPSHPSPCYKDPLDSFENPLSGNAVKFPDVPEVGELDNWPNQQSIHRYYIVWDEDPSGNWVKKKYSFGIQQPLSPVEFDDAGEESYFDEEMSCKDEEMNGEWPHLDLSNVQTNNTLCSPTSSSASSDNTETDSASYFDEEDTQLLEDFKLKDEDEPRGDHRIVNLNYNLYSRSFFDNVPKMDLPLSSRFGTVIHRSRVPERIAVPVYNKITEEQEWVTSSTTSSKFERSP